MANEPLLIRPNSKGECNLGELVSEAQQYLGRARADGTVVLTPVQRTPFIGEVKEDGPTSGSTA